MWTSPNLDDDLRIIADAGIPYRVIKFNTMTLLFREAEAPCVDYFPATGRWRIVGGTHRGRSFRGGANAFVTWYQRHRGNR